MKKIEWFSKKKILRIDEPSKNVSFDYISKGEVALRQMANSVDKTWETQAAYYAIYHSVYSLLARLGIKSESHSATFEVLSQVFSDYFDKEEIKFISKAHDVRNDLQYYTNKNINSSDMNLVIKRAPEFVVKSKTILFSINEREINILRDKFRKYCEIK